MRLLREVPAIAALEAKCVLYPALKFGITDEGLAIAHPLIAEAFGIGPMDLQMQEPEYPEWTEDLDLCETDAEWLVRRRKYEAECNRLYDRAAKEFEPQLREIRKRFGRYDGLQDKVRYFANNGWDVSSEYGGHPLTCMPYAGPYLFLAIREELGARLPPEPDPMDDVERKLKAERDRFQKARAAAKAGAPKGVPQIFPSNGRVGRERKKKTRYR